MAFTSPRLCPGFPVHLQTPICNHYPKDIRGAVPSLTFDLDYESRTIRSSACFDKQKLILEEGSGPCPDCAALKYNSELKTIVKRSWDAGLQETRTNDAYLTPHQYRERHLLGLKRCFYFSPNVMKHFICSINALNLLHLNQRFFLPSPQGKRLEANHVESGPKTEQHAQEEGGTRSFHDCGGDKRRSKIGQARCGAYEARVGTRGHY